MKSIAGRSHRSASFPLISDHIQLGKEGEEAAARFLRKNGYRILYRNFQSPKGGEIDIVARDCKENELVFIEVKTRSTDKFGRPAEAVDAAKQMQIIKAANYWLFLLDKPDVIYRFDIVEVIPSEPAPRHILNAFHPASEYALF